MGRSQGASGDSQFASGTVSVDVEGIRGWTHLD